MLGLFAGDIPLLIPARGRERGAPRAASELLFQPRCRLPDRSPMALEVTVMRSWPRLGRGLVPLREVGLDRAMLREACGFAAGCSGTAAPLLSVRVTEAQAASGLLAQLIGEILCESGLAPERLELELSEDSLKTDEADMLYTLAALRDIGVGVVLGGFGSGVSSLTLLRRRGVAGLLSGVKLDQALTRELGEQDSDAGFLRGLGLSAHALGLLWLAEGVETELQHRRLLQAGCDGGAGSWFAPAAPAADLTSTLRQLAGGCSSPA